MKVKEEGSGGKRTDMKTFVLKKDSSSPQYSYANMNERREYWCVHRCFLHVMIPLYMMAIIGFAFIYLVMAEQGIIYLTFFNICYLFLILTYGIYIFTISKDTVSWKAIITNAYVWMAAGLRLNVLPSLLLVCANYP